VLQPVVFLRPPTILQLVEEGVTDKLDVRKFAVFENPPAGDSRPSVRDLLYLVPKSETLDVPRV